MALTRDFREMVMARAKRAPKFRAALSAEAATLGDKKEKMVLRALLRHPAVRVKRVSKGDGR
jgi:hypothetical protein